jgi:type II secretory pathway pseudopilin PulG
MERRTAAEAGYNLVVLVIAISVMSIMLAAMLPLASTAIRRDKEEELIFRGLQYAEALRVYQIRFQQPPTKLEQLLEVKPRCIRKLWKDPMTDDGKWGILYAGQGEPLVNQGQGPGTSKEEPEKEGGAKKPGGKKEDPVQVGPIVGVYSKSSKKSILIFMGKERYDEWRFTSSMLTGRVDVPGASAGGAAAVLSTKWLGRPMRGMNQGGMPAGVQNGGMPDSPFKPKPPTKPSGPRKLP